MSRNKSTVFLILLFLPFLLIPQVYAERGIAVRTKLEKASGKTIGKYRALIIGINDYKDNRIPDLETAVNDAKSVANILRKDYGFTEVKLLLNSNANASMIQKELRKLATKSEENDSVLIYYAGHGDLDKITKDGWWIPHNATAQDPSTYIDNSVIQKYVRAIPARHVLLVADSCFSGSLFGRARSLPSVIDDKYYANLFKEKSRWGMTSGNLTPVSDTGAEGHSMFAYQFIKTLRENGKPYLTPREIYQNIAPIISNNSDQMPITKPIKHADDQGGEFIFIRTAELASQPAQIESDINKEQQQLEAERQLLAAERKRLEEEKRLMSERKKLAEERRKLEEEKEQMKMASLTQDMSKGLAVERSSDGRYTDNGDGTITDSQTGLMWTKKDSWNDSGGCKDWNDSRSYVNRLNTGGYSDWRMPTVMELKTIYEKSKKIKSAVTAVFSKYSVHLDSIFASGGAPGYWSSGTAGSCCARGIGFIDGRVFKYGRDLCSYGGVRAVRR